MLVQLMDYWVFYKYNQWGGYKTILEINIWLEQHSVTADDFAFGIALAMRNYIRGDWYGSH